MDAQYGPPEHSFSPSWHENQTGSEHTFSPAWHADQVKVTEQIDATTQEVMEKIDETLTQ